MSGLTGEIATKGVMTGDLSAVFAKDGKDGQSVTHEWDGTTLKVTSASGTSSADLKGDAGNPGVYLGSGDMPSDCNVQIDPNGEPIDLQKEIEKALKSYVGGSTARLGDVTLLASAWVGNNSPYSQVVNVDGVTENSQVDLTPSIEQLAVFHHKDLAFVTENVDGVVTVYALGDKPLNDYTIQVTITEVYV